MSAGSSHRVGIFGGSFDPPHQAHVQLAQAAMSSWNLAKLWVFPTPRPSHREGPKTDFSHRLKMTELAFQDMASVQVSDLEAIRPGPSYTIDTVEAVLAQDEKAELFLLVGADQAEVFDTWHRWQDILSLCRLVVWARPDSGPPAQALVQWHNDRQMALQFLALPPTDLSSTQLRAQIRHSPHIHPNGISPAVWHYLQSHHLYRN